MTSGKYCEQPSESNAKKFLLGKSERDETEGARRKGRDGRSNRSSRKYKKRDRKVKLNDSLEVPGREETPDIASLPGVK